MLMSRRNAEIKLKRLINNYCFIFVCILLIFSNLVHGAPTLKEKYDLKELDTNDDFIDLIKDYTDYSSLLQEYEQNQYQPADGDFIRLTPKSSLYFNGETPEMTINNEKTGPEHFINWTDENRLVWKVEVLNPGLYEIEIEYMSGEDSTIEIQRRLYINGKVPCRQAENIFLNRRWIERDEILVDSAGDEKSPRLVQIFEWRKMKVYDSKGMYSEPLKFYLSKGENEISLEYISSTFLLGDILLVPAIEIPEYSIVLEDYLKKGYKGYSGDSIIKLAQEAEFRSHQVLRRIYDPDPSTNPSPKGKIVMNTIGGGRWQKGLQEITWILDVPEDGLYRLGFRIKQNFSLGVSVHRQIKINGKVPFREFLEYPFSYEKEWRTQEIVDGNDEGFLIYLEKGENEISLTVFTGKLTPLINALENSNFLLSEIIRDITTVTSAVPDPNFRYRLDETIPWIIDDLKELESELILAGEYMLSISSRRPPIANTLFSSAQELESMIENPNRIPRKINDLYNMQNSLANWYNEMHNQPLIVDYVELAEFDKPIGNFKATIWQYFVAWVQDFLQSFTRDYEGMAQRDSDDSKEYIEDLEVWVARPKEWAELLQQLADEDFTRDSNILVNINMLPPAGVGAAATSPLMLSVISGMAPDVALGSDMGAPVEYAIRDATYNLGEFKDFEIISKRFLPGAMKPLEFRGGTYALPETMDIPLMFYRTDIVNQLGIELPETWSDMYRKTLPMLRQNGTQMYMLLGYDAFLFQNGGEFYKNDNQQTALDSEAAYTAFVQWTNTYSVFRVEAVANLLNHFRIGSIPIAIGSLGDYIMITHSAPQLYGRWNIMPIPGTMQKDGSIDRSAGGGISSAMIMAQTEKHKVAWEFLKWWTGESVQLRFGTEIESAVGPEARWNTANTNAFSMMDWNKEHLEVMKEAWEWYKNPPNVLGGYFSGRHVQNAWTRVVLGNMTTRDSFEIAIEEINRELERKNKEYKDIYSK